MTLNALDTYLNRFEITCRAFNVPHEQWSFQLARFLQGQVLDVYQRMTDTSGDMLPEGCQ